MIFNFQSPQFHYDPYPIGVIKSVFSPEDYDRMVREWPPFDKFAYMEKLGKKYSLSELNNAPAYHEYVRSSPIWGPVHEEIKSSEFIEAVIAMLNKHQIDLGLSGRMGVVNGRLEERRVRWGNALACLRTGVTKQLPLKSRFEFSMLPADGGNIKPHTDSPQKLMTLVVAIVGEGEWDAAHGGGTAVLRAKRTADQFNELNRQLEFDQVEHLHSFPFEPNQCVIFVKTFNSLHAVYTMTGAGSGRMRKTLTINIETLARQG
jgi:hypothetical protein